VLAGCDMLGGSVEDHLLKAKDLEAHGQIKEALIEYKNAVQKAPDSAEARMLLGQAYLKTGDGTAAEKELKRARDLGTGAESLFVPLGEAYLLQGKLKELLAEITPGKQTSAGNQGKILRLRADALTAQRQYGDACALYAQALPLNPSHVNTYWGLSDCALARRDVAGALARLDEANKAAGAHAATWIKIGEVHRLTGKYKDAEAAYSQALKVKPDNVAALVHRAGIRLELGNREGARADVGAARKLNPEDTLVRYMQARLAYIGGNYKQAAELLQSVLRAPPWHYQSALLYGMTALKLGYLDTAHTYFGALKDARPTQGLPRYMEARVALELGRPHETLDLLAPFMRAEKPWSNALALAGEAQFLVGNYAEAERLLEAAKQAAPKDVGVLTNLARSQLAQGEIETGIGELENAALLDTKSSLADIALVSAHLARAQYAEALAAIDALAKKQPNSAQVESLRGTVHLKQQDKASARRHFEAALKLDPTYLQAAVNLARLETDEGRFSAARGIFEKLLAKQPGSLDGLLAMAGLARAQGRMDEYQQWIGKAAKSNPRAIRPPQLLAEYYLSSGDAEKALASVNEALNLQPGSPELVKLLAEVQTAAGEMESALSSYGRLTTLAPLDPMTHLALANAQVRARKLSAARISIRRAMELKPGLPTAKFALASVELADGKRDVALAIARELQNSGPGDPHAHVLAADILVLQGKLAEAAALYDRAYGLGASGPVAMSLLKTRRALGQKAQAYVQIADWLKRQPDDAAARLVYASALFKDGRQDEAVKQYEYLLRRNPDSVAVLNELALIYQARGNPRALELAEHAYKLNDAPAFADTLGWILLEQGKTERALELLESAYKLVPDHPSIAYHRAVALSRAGRDSEAMRTLERAIASKAPFPERDAARALLAKVKGA
jgi:putative PEP-CTERM system TPR-repeat lipoprotein